MASPAHAELHADAHDLHAELLYHLHAFSHGIGELGHGWQELALQCVPCVGARGGRPCDADGPASPPAARRPLAAVPMVPLGGQAVAVTA
jgi:hypothetical protein